MKAVVVSQRIDVYPERNEKRDALDQQLIRWVVAAGFLPFPIPNSLQTDIQVKAWLSIIKPVGVILSGGNDIGSEASRDFTETWLFEYAKTNRLPMLGICRGMQMMAHQYDINLQPVKGHVATRHRVHGEIEGEVNSFHGYSLSQCPDGFKIIAHSEDAMIEAIKHQTLPWEGWMWHPEREPIFESRDLSRFKVLFGG
jgi:putative glutamine amidotransferase